MSSGEIQIRQRVRENKSSEDEEEESNSTGKRTKEKNSSRPITDDKKSNVAKPKRKKKKDENLTCSRLIAYLMISPTLIYVMTILYNVISKYSFAGKFYHVAALLLGAIAVTSLCIYFYKSLQAYLKYMAFLSLLIFFIPTMQVFNCSPVHLNNKDLGKTFKLQEGPENFIKIAYQQSECWKNQKFKTPYDLSMYTPSLKLTVKLYQVVNLMMHHFDEKDDEYEGPPVDSLPHQLFLLTSQRSVRRQMYNLNLLTMVSGRIETLSEIMELGMDDRENVTLDITGHIAEMGPNFDNTKKELEEMEFLLRPLVFHVHRVEVFGAPEEQTENPEEYEADKSKWKKKQNKKRDGKT